MKVLVLGSQGFIGGHLVAFLSQRKFEVAGCDIVEYSTANYRYQKLSVNSADFEVFFAEGGFDVCINASGSGNVAYSLQYPMTDYEANTGSVVSVLDTIRKCQPQCKYVHISSAAVYGNPTRLPVHEDDSLMPLSPYGFHKTMSETICREFYEIFQIPVAIVRPFSVYGNGLKKQLLWDVCTKLRGSDSIRLFGTGDESRDFLHITDLCRIMDMIIEKSPFRCNVYNAASGTETTIKMIAAMFEQNFPGKKDILFSGEEKKGDPINWRADISRIENYGFQPAADLNKSIADYIDWYLSLKDEY